MSRIFRARRDACRTAFAAWQGFHVARASRHGAFGAIMARFHRASRARVSSAPACHASRERSRDPAPTTAGKLASLTPSGEKNHGCHRHRRRDRRHRHRLSIACGRTPRMRVERHATVAQGATYGHGGTVLPSPLDVWFGPTFMAQRAARNKTGIVFKPGFNDRDPRVRRSSSPLLRDPDAFSRQYARLRPLVDLSRRGDGEIEAALRARLRTAHGRAACVPFASTNSNRPRRRSNCCSASTCRIAC